MLTRRAGNPAVSTARARRNPTVRDFRDRIRPGSGLLTHRPHPMRRCRWHLPTHRERPGQCPLKAGYRRRGEASLRVCAGQAVLRTVSVAVRAMGCLDARVHGHIADSVGAANAESAAFTQVSGYMVWIGAEHCKTVGSAYVGSNPTPATHFPRSEPVTRDRVTGFYVQSKRFRRPLALVCGPCVGQMRESAAARRERGIVPVSCGNSQRAGGL